MTFDDFLVYVFKQSYAKMRAEARARHIPLFAPVVWDLWNDEKAQTVNGHVLHGYGTVLYTLISSHSTLAW